jgi:hypothetical protein
LKTAGTEISGPLQMLTQFSLDLDFDAFRIIYSRKNKIRSQSVTFYTQKTLHGINQNQKSREVAVVNKEQQHKQKKLNHARL